MEKKDKLQQKLEEAEEKKKEYLNGWKRARADLANYKKEESKRLQRFLEFSRAEWILELLPVLDSFYRAKDLSGKEKEGLERIRKQFEDFLEKEGVKRIEVLGKEFDPSLAEAVEEVESDKEPGTVVEVLRNGYRMGERLLRPAKVVVSKKN